MKNRSEKYTEISHFLSHLKEICTYNVKNLVKSSEKYTEICHFLHFHSLLCHSRMFLSGIHSTGNPFYEGIHNQKDRTLAINDKK